jgi:uncharacterized membrane protein
LADLSFASPIPLWSAALLAAAVGAIAYFSYRQPLVPLTSRQRGVLMILRALALGAVIVFLCRPTISVTPPAGDDVVVPVLIDVSRSMRITDADGRARLSTALDYVNRDLLPSLRGRFRAELYRIGDAIEEVPADKVAGLQPDARRTQLLPAVAGVQERSRRQRVAGIVVLSDGGDTGGGLASSEAEEAPVFALGVGSPAGPPDREVLAIAAGDPQLDQSTIDVRVSAASRGFGRDSMQVRLLGNGRLLDTRSVTAAAEGAPIDVVFTVSPEAAVPTVYTAEITGGDEETIRENNTRSVLVGPAGRTRRVLMLAGAPGYDHSFAIRALAADPGLEVDSVVRKGKNDAGEDTFLVQAGGGRGAALARGVPASREALFGYDAVVIANLEGEFFTRAQLSLLSAFVSERGGGLVVFGSRSFAQRGLTGTPLEEVLPVELSDRRGGLARTGLDIDRSAPHHAVAVTPGGEDHPIMRIAPTPADSAAVWGKLPPLAAVAALGGPRPGATVLAVTSVPSGGVYPLIAIQRYGRGRSMVFAGEASWRWRMMRPAADRSYEYFWRQTARWLAAPAPEPVTVSVPDASEPGDAIELGVEARDAAFAPAADAAIEATLTMPGAQSRPLAVRPQAGSAGRFAASIRPEAAGLYRLQVEARRGTRVLGSVDRWFYVGGTDREFSDPRLNEALLKRMARESGGRYAPLEEADVAAWLQAAAPREVQAERRELWHAPWAFLLVIALLAGEWVLRRRWGLR